MSVSYKTNNILPKMVFLEEHQTNNVTDLAM